MFKNLKEKIATQVTKTNQTLLSTILPTDSENNRSRINSTSSDISFSYVSPTRHYMPPSDIESEHGEDENDNKIEKLLYIYKNKYSQLKKAYDEIEHEKDQIKNILQQFQDSSIKRQTELREQIKIREKNIHELQQQTIELKNLIQPEQEEIRNLREKIIRLESLLRQCKEAINSHQEKENNFEKERDELLQKLNEKQTLMESMMKNNQNEETSPEVKEQFDADISILLNDKERLQEQLETTKQHLRRIENELELSKQQIQLDNEHEQNQLKQKYDDLFNEKLNLEKTHEQQLKSFDGLKTEYENLTNELHQIKQVKSNEENQLTSDEIDQMKTLITKLQNENNETLIKCTQLTQTIDVEHKENQLLKSQIENLKIEYKEQISLLENELKLTNNKFEDKTNELKQYEEKLKFIEKQLEEKENHNKQIQTIIQEHEQFRQSIETSQNNTQQILEEKDKEINTLKQNLSNSLTNQKEDYDLNIKKLNQEHENIVEELNLKLAEINNKKQNDIENLQQENNQFQIKFNNILLEKSNLENELDRYRIQIQTTESLSGENSIKLEQNQQTIKQLEIECDSYRNEIETLKSEIMSLININEENTRRIDEFENEKFNFVQEINEKDREIKERDEKIQDMDLSLKQSQETATKLRNALQKLKESTIHNEQINTQDAESQLQKLTAEYEQRLTDQQTEFNTKLKSMAKEMNAKIDEKEQNYNQQLNDFIQKSYKTENDLVNHSEQRINNAEQRAIIAEEQMSKMEENFKEKQLDHYRNIQELQTQIENLIKENIQTSEDSCQTTIESLNLDNQHTFLFEPTEIDYLKKIILAYMTGTDRITMAKVICAVLRYSDDEKSLIIEHEKFRQSRWLKSSR